MNFLTPPTDNLYKFIAIFGLVLIGLSFFVSDLYLDEKHEINKDFSNYLVDAENTEKEYNIAITNYDSLEKEIIELEELGKYDSIQKIKPLQDYYRDRVLKFSRQWSKEAIEGRKLLKRDDYNSKKQKYYGFYSKWLLQIGSVLMIVGFYFWYIKYQKHIDAETKWKGEIYSKLLNDEVEKERIVKEIVDNNSAEKSKPDTQEKE
ncbi:hypothetical protein [Cognatitamlana onchidii]|uniref:hypothetical protein n=1 Tax=Cognatitamlana onchidii TaxID=2562860 RepID=UPI0010A69E00|nr:hypothetical protein [Algibacter onchidii]